MSLSQLRMCRINSSSRLGWADEEMLGHVAFLLMLIGNLNCQNLLINSDEFFLIGNLESPSLIT